jgi:hypothetical protein
VAIDERMSQILFRRQNLPIGNINDSETAMHDGKMRRAGWICAVLAYKHTKQRLKIDLR